MAKPYLNYLRKRLISPAQLTTYSALWKHGKIHLITTIIICMPTNSSPADADPPLDAQSFAFRNSSACKRQKLMTNSSASASSHITVERNRRKQMNDHLSVLRSLMPCFYVKRGDQASIIGGLVDYINELQQVLQSLEAKKQRKAAYSEVMSPRTPQPSSPYSRPWMHPSGFLNSPPSPCNSSTSSSVNDVINDLVATSKSPLAEVEVKFSGPNLLLKTVSHRLPGQVLKIVSTLEQLALEILHLSISTVDEKMLNSFTIKIGIQCQVSAEDLAEQIQQTFC